MYKKDSKNSKENYRPVSIFPNISKIYGRCLFKPISNYFENIFSKFQCGFRQGPSAQYCLTSMIEKWKKSVDKGKTFAALLTDLSKVFDCLSHDLIIAKPNAYGFSLSAARLMQSYLCNRKQRTKINAAYSSWEEILFGVPQGTILEPLLFNIFICDLFLIMNKVDFASYGDDNTPYVIGNGVKEAMNSLKEASDSLFYWSANNQMKANPDKCHLLTSSNDKVSICVDNYNIKSSKCEKFLGIKIDNNYNFNTHVDEKESRTEIKCAFKSYPLHGPFKTTYTVKCIFHFTIQLLSISLDVS